MQYRRLGQAGVKVSAICLGTHTFGESTADEAAFAVMDAFGEAGGNFIDTSDIYADGKSETVIGRWMRERHNRSQIVLATKARWPDVEWAKREGLSRSHLMQACDDSLRRLQTDYIDLYQIHWDDTETPLAETLSALDDLVRMGKVRYIGCSNIPAWRLALALGVSERGGLAHYTSLQPHYNLAHRAEFERELEPLCLDQGIGVMPYSPLAGGFFSGKYQRNQPLPTSDRGEGIQARYFNEQGWALLDIVTAIANEHNAPPTQIALAWLLARPAVTAPINGARTPEQLKLNLGALDLRLSTEQIARLDKASAWQKA